MKNKVIVTLAGEDGNAFAILGRFSAAARKVGWTPEEIKEVVNEATKGDYDHLLMTIMNNSEDRDEDDDSDNKDDIKCINCHEKWSKWDICDDCEFCPDCCEC